MASVHRFVDLTAEERREGKSRIMQVGYAAPVIKQAISWLWAYVAAGVGIAIIIVVLLVTLLSQVW